MQRKTDTALFADIKASMELMEDLDPEEARAIVDSALKLMTNAVQGYDGYIVQSTGDGISRCSARPPLMRIIAACALCGSSHAGAAAVLRKTARGGQSANRSPGSCARQVSRLLTTRGRREEARAMLADIYNWFTAGFGTADLKEAKALLEELGGNQARPNLWQPSAAELEENTHAVGGLDT